MSKIKPHNSVPKTDLVNRPIWTSFRCCELHCERTCIPDLGICNRCVKLNTVNAQHRVSDN